MRSRLGVTVVLALVVHGAAPGNSRGGAVPCNAVDPSQAQFLNVGFPHYRPGLLSQDLHYRDLEFLWDSLYVGGLGLENSPVRNTLLKFGSHLVDSTGWNPFGIEVADMQLVYEYFRGTSAPYTLIPEDTTSVWIGANEFDGYNPSDRSHVDIYLHQPTRPLGYAGRYPAGFTSGEEDLTTGHSVFDPLPLNSISVEGPQEAEKVDEAGTGWTASGQFRNLVFNHELQHSLLPRQSTGFGTELFSALAEAVGGNSDTSTAFASVEVPYTWSLISNGKSSSLSCTSPRGLGVNYQGRSSFGAYLVYNFRGVDTSATIGAIHDDLGRRWARSGRTFPDLKRLLRDDSCGTCAQKDYFHPFGPPSGGEPPKRFALDDSSRWALLLHNWRVAAYVNNSFLAEGQYGYPAHMGFSPATHLKAWQDFDGCATDDIINIPPEVTLNASHRTREMRLRGSRSFRGSTYPLTLQPLGAEYWVIRSDPSVWTASQDLFVRVTPEAIHRQRILFACIPSGRDGRLVASVIGYSPPPGEVATGRLWEHPEWATRTLDPIWIDVDSIAGSLEFRLSSFGDSIKAALVVLSLADGPSQGHTSSSLGYEMLGSTDLGEALRYRIDLSLRTDTQHGTAPALLTAGTHPTWAPRDSAVAVTFGSELLLKSFTGFPDYVIVFGSPFNAHLRPDWSPRGDRIVASLRLQGSSTEDVYVHDRVTGGSSRLTYQPGYDLAPVFQPNGQRVAYTRRVTANDTLGTWELRRVDITGANDVVLFSRTGAVLRSPRWSPAGSWIYFLANDSLYAVGVDAPQQGAVVDVRSRLPRAASFDLPIGLNPIVFEQLGEFPWYQQCRVSPGCCSPPNLPGEWTELQMPFRRIALFDTTAVDTIARYYRTGAEFGEPRWSFDGTRVAYTSAEPSGAKFAHLGRPSFNHAPAFSNGLLEDAEWGLAAPAAFWLTGSDPDGEAITFQAAYLPPGASLSSAGYFSWPSPGPLGAEYYVVFRALDPSGGVDNRVVKYTVGTGSGGGGCPYADTRAAAGWQVENSLLARSLTNTLGLDAYRLKAEPANLGGRYHVRLRENEQEYTTVDQVRLVAVDHPAGFETFALGNAMVLGSRVPAARVTTQRGEDVTALVSGLGAGFAGSPGDTLFVEWTTASGAVSGGAGTFGAESIQDCECPPGVLECEGKEEQVTWRGAEGLAARPTGVALDQTILEETGIAIQRSDGQGGWRTVRRHYPREAPDGAAFDSLGQGPTRLVFVGRHRVRFVGRLEPTAATPAITNLNLQVARHSRLGNAKTAVANSGGSATSLVPGDTLHLEFTAPSLATGLTREWFLVSLGVYSSAASPTQLQEAMQHVPLRFALGQNQPNPFRGTTTIQYELPVATTVRLEVFGAQGRRVRVLESSEQPAGFHVAEWGRRDAAGVAAKPGVYLYRMTAGTFREQRKMVLLP